MATMLVTGANRGIGLELCRQLKARGVGLVYISHFLEEVFAVADMVTVLRDGDVVADPRRHDDLQGVHGAP